MPTQTFDADITQTFQSLKDDSNVQSLMRFVKDNLSASIEIQKELALIEAPSFHEEKKARRYAQLLTEAGLEDVTITDEFNVYGFIRGTGNTGCSVLLEAHLDTVFAFGDVKGVTVDDDGRIHCPGICDDTRALAANLNVLQALKAADIKPVHDIIIAATVCEEGLGGMRGMSTLFKTLENKTRVLASLSIDGPTNNVFYANATGVTDWKMTFKGAGGHAWTANKTPSAVHAAARAIAKLADLDLPSDPKTTFTASMISGGQAIHAIAQEAYFTINTRSNGQAALDAVNEAIKKACYDACREENALYPQATPVTVTMEVLLEVPAGSQAETCRIIQAAKVATSTLGVTAQLNPGGCTNANIPIALGIPAVTFGRGGLEYGTHTLDEWFDPKGVEVCEQKSILMLLAIAGISGQSEPLPL